MRHVKQILCLMAICLPIMFTTSCSEDDEEDYGTSTTQGQQGGESEPEPLDVPDIPSNEIWYTSTDGQVVQPYRYGTLGAKLLNNTYSNGKGIITFDAAVTEIGDYAFRGCYGLTSIALGNSVTSIGEDAFHKCSYLKSISIPNSMISIGYEAFRSCSSLTSINIPNSVTTIENCAFEGCSGLSSIKVADGNKVYDSRNNCNAIIETASNTLISGCKNTVIPNTVISIGKDAFRSCSSLTNINIPGSVTSIDTYAFVDCRSLVSINIPGSVISIGYGAFNGCSSLTSINIPNSVTEIGSAAFIHCSSLTSINIPNSVTTIGGMAFVGCSSLTRITVADGNKFYNSRDNCNAIIETASNTLVYGCKNTVIPNSVTSIGDYAFESCTLTSINIPGSVTSIGSSAFSGCKSLTSINIPNSVTSIGYHAFSECTSLTSVYVNWDKPLSISSSTFDEVNLSACTLYVPKETKSLYASADVWKDFGNIVERP